MRASAACVHRRYIFISACTRVRVRARIISLHLSRGRQILSLSLSLILSFSQRSRVMRNNNGDAAQRLFLFAQVSPPSRPPPRLELTLCTLLPRSAHFFIYRASGCRFARRLRRRQASATATENKAYHAIPWKIKIGFAACETR